MFRVIPLILLSIFIACGSDKIIEPEPKLPSKADWIGTWDALIEETKEEGKTVEFTFRDNDTFGITYVIFTERFEYPSSGTYTVVGTSYRLDIFENKEFDIGIVLDIGTWEIVNSKLILYNGGKDSGGGKSTFGNRRD